MDTADTATATTFSWHRMPTCDTAVTANGSAVVSNVLRENSRLEVSNPLVPLPLHDITVLGNFLSIDQTKRLESELVARQVEDSTWEGFDGPRRRVQSYDFDDSSSPAAASECTIPETLLQVRQCLEELTGLTARSARLEEYTPVVHKTAGQTYNPTIMTTFAKPQRQPCACCQREVNEDGDAIKTGAFNDDHEETSLPASCSCFVAEILLISDADTAFVQNWNQPVNRHAVCWYLKSDQHWTDVRLLPNTAIVRKGEMLTEWRSSRILSTCITSKTVRVLKLYSLIASKEEDSKDGTITDNQDDTFGYVASPEDEMERLRRLREPMPPLSDLLTIVITTSPIKSNPSTELLERAMATFEMGGHDFAFRCRKVIICDGFRTQDQESERADDDEQTNGKIMSSETMARTKISRKHGSAKQAMRNGIVTCEQADNYRQFKQNLRKRCVEASSDAKSVFCNTAVVELEERHGYGFALRHAVRHCVETPFVCVIQHDRTFMRPAPVLETVKAMWLHTNIKYVGFSMRSNLVYRDIFLGKYGGKEDEEWNDMVLHVPELLVPASSFGPDSASSKAMMSISNEKLRSNIQSLAETYKGSAQAATSKQPESGKGGDIPARHQMTLTPTLFWYDNVHICDTQHYRDFVFHEPYRMVARGGFVEDKLSPVLKRTVERMGLKEGHSRFGCYLLDDHSGLFFTGHLDGGSYMTVDERRELLASQKR